MEISGWDLAVAFFKALTYAATLAASGGVLFLAYNPSLQRSQLGARIANGLAILMLVAAAATLLKILLAAGSMGNDFASMFDRENAVMILGAGEGRASALRLAGLLLASCILFNRRSIASIAPVGALLAATSFAWVGHAHGLHPNELPLSALCIHLLCAAFWMGSLWPLLQATHDADRTLAAALVERFSRLAVQVVGALILAGALLLLLLLPRVSDLWSSDYGRWLLLKLLLVAGLLSVAAMNKLKLTPRLRRGDARAFAKLRRSIFVEMGLGAAILTVTAVFTTITGPVH